MRSCMSRVTKETYSRENATDPDLKSKKRLIEAILTLSVRPCSDAVLHMSRTEFELRPTQINLGQAELIQTADLKSVHFGKLHYAYSSSHLKFGVGIKTGRSSGSLSQA